MSLLKRVQPMATILVVEDDEEMRSLLQDFLRDEGYESDSADNGSAALRKLTGQPFDLVITDIRMPVMTGLDLLAAAKKLHPKIPVIVITAFWGEEAYRRSLARGADGYLEKPIHLDRLRSLIHEFILPPKKTERLCGKDMPCGQGG